MANKKVNGTAAPERAMCRVFIPKTHREDSQTYVAVNGKNAVIRNGESVTVPAPLAWAVRDSERAGAKAEKFVSENSRN